MSIAGSLRRAPGRIAAGGFILNSGLTKLKADEATATAVHGMAVGTYPFLGKVDAKTFTRALALSEVALGGALLLPIVPPAVAGAGLAAFSGGLLGLYWRTPGMHPDGDPRPTQQGIPVAKDIWMAGIALGLLADAFLPEGQPHRVVRRAERRAIKAEAAAAAADVALAALSQRRSSAAPHKRQARQYTKIAEAKARALQDAARAQATAQAHTAKAHAKSAGKVAQAQVGSARTSLGSALTAASESVQPATQATIAGAKSGLEGVQSAASATLDAAKSAAAKAPGR
jgi:hypothetical protein